MKIANKKYIGLLFLGMIALFQSCKSDPDSPGTEYMPDMYRSPAIEPYVDYGEIRNKTNVNLKTQLSALTPPNETVPYCVDCVVRDSISGKVIGIDTARINRNLYFELPANYGMDSTHALFARNGYILGKKGVDNYELAKGITINPVPKNKSTFEKGEKLYESMCMHCHGKLGDGKGKMVTSGAYEGSGIPNYKGLDLSVGQMFYSISYGRNMMGAHASLLSKEEIWTIIHHVKKLQLGDDYVNESTNETKNETKNENSESVDSTKGNEAAENFGR